MTIDDLLRRRFEERRPDVELDAAWGSFDRRRRLEQRRQHVRRRALAAAVVLIICAAGVAVVGLTRGDGGPAPVRTGPSTTSTTAPEDRVTPPDRTPDSWRTLPDAPLAPRFGSSTVWTGTEMVIAGGAHGEVCAPDGRCTGPPPTELSDGAAYDPATDTWRLIATAPMTFAKAPTVWTGDVMLVLSASRLLAYDPRTDTWEQRSDPPTGIDLVDGDVLSGDGRDYGDPVWTGELAVFVSTDNANPERPDWAYDPATDDWSELAADPLGCSYGRVMVPVGGSLVLIGTPCPTEGSPDHPPYQAARFDLASQDWHRLPDADRPSDCGCWFASGDLVVDPTTILHSYSGPYLPDDGRPVGGVLDLATETWSDPAPVGAVGADPVSSARQNYVGPAGDWIAAGTRLYAPATRTWHEVPAGPDAAWDRAAVWTGTEIITWGGTTDDFQRQIATGAAYTPPAPP